MPVGWVKWAVVAAVVGVAAIVAGSALYWDAEGRPGTPADFRQRVEDAGLTVEWSNSGPRGGSGTVDTDCGPVAVEVDLIDDDLWVRWAGRREPMSAETVAVILGCGG